MKETKRARPTLICSRLKEVEEGETEAEVLGAKGIQMELLHRRLGHTLQSVIQRLVRDQMVRGLEEGAVREYKMCRGCKMGRSSEKSHPRKDPEFRAKEPLELVHTDIAGPFLPVAMGGGQEVQSRHDRRLQPQILGGTIEEKERHRSSLERMDSCLGE